MVKDESMPSYKTRISNEALRMLVQNHPEYRSSTSLATYLNMSRSAAREYLLSAGIEPMNITEGKLVQHFKQPYKNKPSEEALKELIEDDPAMRSPSILSKHLGVSPAAATRYLLLAGIKTMTISEAKLVQHLGGHYKNKPSEEALKELIEDDPAMRSPTILAGYLGVSPSTARNYLNAANIQPMNLSEGKLVKYNGSNVKILTSQELVALVEREPKYRSALILSTYLNIGNGAAARYLRKAGIEPMSRVESRHIIFSPDVKMLTDQELVDIVKENPEYASESMLAKYLGISPTGAKGMLLRAGITPMTQQEALLLSHEIRTGVKMIADGDLAKLVEQNPGYRSANYLGKYLGIKNTRARRWLLRAGITPMTPAEAHNFNFDNGRGINSVVKINDAPSFREFVETHEDAQRVVSLFYHGSTAGGMIDMLAARILALYYPGIVDEEVAYEYLPSLGPYIGRFKRPDLSGFGGDVIGSIPMPIINNDKMLREGFLKIGRDYYMSLLRNDEYPSHEDEETLLGLIKEKAIAEGNEPLKWLHGTLYDEFQRFLTLTRKARKLMPEKEAMA
ncbi:MAG: hypothetical protein HY364_01845 [Candidatus Aenigmarchaeota archaeon]|nr:hypothetical protein [Candidatus Aenigmarchaeota archaeon]